MLGVGNPGAGFFGACHARAVAALEGARIVAACSEELPLAEAFTAEHGGRGPKGTSSPVWTIGAP
jgi:phthalate 4,5-cis-dihydrodiol dehydrogenase